ncbi:hypothetical protein SxD43FB_20640 [Sphingobium sp. D43FB]|nr:hypothetical protein SxD43FB_20640 [Sphingobium sp. D43FB]
MPVDIRVEDTDLVGFSDLAKDGVKKAGKDFIKHIIAEANRLDVQRPTTHLTPAGHRPADRLLKI